MAAVRPCMAAVLASMIWPVTSPQAWMRHVRAAELVHGQRAALAELHAGRLQAEVAGVGPHADAEQQVRAEKLAAVLQQHPDALGSPVSIAAARPMLDHVHAALEEDLLEHLGQVGIVVGQDLVASRDERHPGAAAGESRRTHSRSGPRPARPRARGAHAGRTPGGWSAPVPVGMGERRRERRGARADQQRVERHLVVAAVVHHQVVPTLDAPQPGSTWTFMPSIRSRTPRL